MYSYFSILKFIFPSYKIFFYGKVNRVNLYENSIKIRTILNRYKFENKDFSSTRKSIRNEESYFLKCILIYLA